MQLACIRKSWTGLWPVASVLAFRYNHLFSVKLASNAINHHAHYSQLYSQWATMSDDKSDLVFVPFNMLRAEKKPHPNPIDVEKQKIFIRERIIDQRNTEIVNDKEARSSITDWAVI